MSQIGSNVMTVPRVGGRAYYGWVVLGVAALAMVGTLPGRTQGLGLITEPLIRDLGLSRVVYTQVNLVATLIGALFCIGVGRLIDRLGSRLVLTVTAVALGLTVLTMSQASSLVGLLIFVTLTRGFGQSALSVVSLAMVGKWFRRRLTVAMAIYALVMSIGFMVAFPLVGAIVQSAGWRIAWASSVSRCSSCSRQSRGGWTDRRQRRSERTLTAIRRRRWKGPLPRHLMQGSGRSARRCARRRSGSLRLRARCMASSRPGLDC